MKNMLANLNTTQRNLLVAIAAVIIYVISTTISYSAFTAMGGKPNLLTNNNGSAVPTAPSIQDEPNEPRTEACPLNGEMHTKTAKNDWVKRRPLGVMIENSTEARPQSGVSYADVVYEAVAEGGITRFLSVFYCEYPEVQVGPVRSARTYFLDWISEYNGLYAHVGGANTPGPADALGQIVTYDIKDLNQFGIGFPTFWRDYQRLGRTVATEHTMYSTTKKLWAEGAKRDWSNVDEAGLAWDKSFVSWKFKDDQANAGQVGKASVPFWASYNDYTVTWNYDGTCNCYKRSHGTNAHNDLDNNKQLSPKNVVVQFMIESHAHDGYPNDQHLLYQNKGQGKALILQDGKVISGTWSKATRLSRTKFMDDSGKEISFNRGQIWIQTVPTGSNVTY